MTFKATIDSIAPALGFNDRIVLPCARSRHKVATKDERMVVTVENVEA